MFSGPVFAPEEEVCIIHSDESAFASITNSSNPGGSQFIDLRDHLATNVVKIAPKTPYTLEGHKEYMKTVKTIGGFNEALSLLGEIGTTEARRSGYDIPPCFTERINELKNVITIAQTYMLDPNRDDCNTILLWYMIAFQIKKLSINKLDAEFTDDKLEDAILDSAEGRMLEVCDEDSGSRFDVTFLQFWEYLDGMKCDCECDCPTVSLC